MQLGHRSIGIRLNNMKGWTLLEPEIAGCRANRRGVVVPSGSDPAQGERAR